MKRKSVCVAYFICLCKKIISFTLFHGRNYLFLSSLHYIRIFFIITHFLFPLSVLSLLIPFILFFQLLLISSFLSLLPPFFFLFSFTSITGSILFLFCRLLPPFITSSLFSPPLLIFLAFLLLLLLFSFVSGFHNLFKFILFHFTSVYHDLFPSLDFFPIQHHYYYLNYLKSLLYPFHLIYFLDYHQFFSLFKVEKINVNNLFEVSFYFSFIPYLNFLVFSLQVRSFPFSISIFPSLSSWQAFRGRQSLGDSHTTFY